MSGRRERQKRGAGRLCRWTPPRALAALACLAAVALRSAAAESVDPADPGLSTARQELDALKAGATASRAGVSTGAEGPSIALPHMDTGAGTAPAVVSPRLIEADPNKAKKKDTDNWLVDAMERAKKEEQAGRLSAGAARRSGIAAESGTTEPAESDELAGEGDRLGRQRETTRAEDDVRRPAPSAVVNPLARYMADWLSPQDYALLQRTLETSGSGQALPMAASPGASGMAEVAAQSASFGEPAGKPASLLQKPADNPFLAAFAQPETSPSRLAVQQPSAPEPMRAPVQQMNPPQEAEAKPAVPAFVKPDQDKYFKPLKRF